MTLRAERARVGRLVTIEDRSSQRAGSGIGNEWTRRHYDGSFQLVPAPATMPALSLVMVQTREGNTGADNPSDLGGGDTDLHLIYEGLSRVAAHAVLAGGRTATGHVVFSVWHPAMVALREELGLTRHPAQIVISRDGNLDVSGTLLFNVPEVPVFLIAGDRCYERCRTALRDRQWTTFIRMREGDLVQPLSELSDRGVRRISVIGGRSTASALIDAGLIQDLCLTTTSLSAGEPDTPFYIGARQIAFDPIVRKRSADDERLPIRFDHSAIAAVS